jgi:hypothetical protein
MPLAPIASAREHACAGPRSPATALIGSGLGESNRGWPGSCPKPPPMKNSVREKTLTKDAMIANSEREPRSQSICHRTDQSRPMQRHRCLDGQNAIGYRRELGAVFALEAQRLLLRARLFLRRLAVFEFTMKRGGFYPEPPVVNSTPTACRDQPLPFGENR